MREQSKILEEMQELVMDILKTGVASEAEGNRLDELEELMLEQKCYQKGEASEYPYIGEEIGALFFKNSHTEAVDKMHKFEITPEEFFEFAEYHYEDEPQVEMFTSSFIADAGKLYQSKLEANK